MAEAAQAGRDLLGPEDVLPGVADVLTEVSVEAVFDDGTRLVVVADPIGGDSLGALAPGAVLTMGPAETTSGGISVLVTNTASVPISVSSTLPFLRGEPTAAFRSGRRIRPSRRHPAGATVPLRAWQHRAVTLVPIGGDRVAIGFLRSGGRAPRRSGAETKPFDEPGCAATSTVEREAMTLSGHDYAATYGPRRGDRVRLGDSNLVVEIEDDSSRPGDEFLAGFGKTAGTPASEGRRRPRKRAIWSSATW